MVRGVKQLQDGRRTQTTSDDGNYPSISRWRFLHFLYSKVPPSIKLSSLRPLASKFGNDGLASTMAAECNNLDLKNLLNEQQKTKINKSSLLYCRRLMSCFSFSATT